MDHQKHEQGQPLRNRLAHLYCSLVCPMPEPCSRERASSPCRTLAPASLQIDLSAADGRTRFRNLLLSTLVSANDIPACHSKPHNAACAFLTAFLTVTSDGENAAMKTM